MKDVASEYQTKKRSTVKHELQSINGVSVKSETVFTGALKFCKQKAMEYFKAKHMIFKENKIQWVITVPAIWSEEIKGLMRRWAQQAKIWSPSIPNQLIIALEPECASACVLFEMQDNHDKIQFKKGDCYMLMDLGAGLPTWCVMKSLTDLNSYIDNDLQKIFDSIFGREEMQKFRQQDPKQYVQLLENIEKSKQRFFINKRTEGVHRIEISFEFDQFMQQNITDDLEKRVSNFEYLGESGLVHCFFCLFCLFICLHSYDHEDLSLSCSLWMKLFDLRIDPIIKLMDEMLKTNEQILKKKLKYVCLVGGFSESSYLQYKLKNITNGNTRAAQFARAPSFITSRIVKYAYGNSACLPIEYTRSHPKIGTTHIDAHKYICDIDNEEYVSHCFVTFVDKGEPVKVNQVTIATICCGVIITSALSNVNTSYSKLSKEQKGAYISLFRSEEIDPGVTTDCVCLGKIDIPYPEDFSDDEEYVVRFYFGETMIRVTVTMKGKEYIEQEVQIKYDFGSQYLDAPDGDF
ncbi:hypothetical protein RFI_20518 [Reticulomyxa filosa]|uniref:Uncharacterized protein n=1 Tax=Reticulomyxa filosa TaxID=46433 RepID=X6MT45_RETFI|nr:hypothetical protein RFI_20518 [Reticulomyxa filosa]|eukprot:ETO16821.1 hypothetical protein RFI_20518 [Reticulomyxa filosa]